MMLILGLIVSAIIALAAFAIGYGAGSSHGYALGEKHGAENERAAARVYPRHTFTFGGPTRTTVPAPASGAEIARALVRELDRRKAQTMGLNGTRTDALEQMPS